MKLLFVHQHLGAFGGAEANILLTASELSRRGHEVGLLYGGGTGKNEAAWHEIFHKSFALGSEPSSPRIREVCQQFEPDLIYVHKLDQLSALESLLRINTPVVRMVHDHDLYCMRSYKYNYFTRSICTRKASLYCVFPCMASLGRNRQGRFPLKWNSYRAKQKELRLNRQCRRFIVYSEYARQELVRNGFAAEKIHIHVPIRCWEDGPVSSLSERNLILFAGQIIRGKGVDLLLHALSRLTIPFECVILGEGNHRPYCEQLCRRLGLNDRVRFAGFVPQEQMKEYFLQSSVFAVSSVWPEPFGMVGPEAMRYGLPVVAFDAGGIREWLIDGENGYLVPWMDTDRFAARLQELLRDKNLARDMGRRGQERVNATYTASSQVDRLEQIFETVLHDDPPRNAEQTIPVALCAASLTL